MTVPLLSLAADGSLFESGDSTFCVKLELSPEVAGGEAGGGEIVMTLRSTFSTLRSTFVLFLKT